MRNKKSLVPWMLLSVLTLSDSWATHEEADDEADAWDDMLEALRTLWSGSRAERLEVALDAENRFEPLDDPPRGRMKQARQ